MLSWTVGLTLEVLPIITVVIANEVMGAFLDIKPDESGSRLGAEGKIGIPILHPCLYAWHNRTSTLYSSNDNENPNFIAKRSFTLLMDCGTGSNDVKSADVEKQFQLICEAMPQMVDSH